MNDVAIASPCVTRRRRFASITLALIASLAVAGFSLFLFTRNNDFPTDYHPDEWSKVRQLQSLSHDRNLNHPLLMIETADLARQAWHVPIKDGRQIAIAGRWASAILASVGVFALCMTGFVAHGWIGLAIVGPAIALCPPLLVYAHYLKEDATLIGGLAVCVLGTRLVLSSRRAIAQLPATIVLGVGCAMAASGKYVGVAACAPALLAIVIAPLARWWLWPIRLLLVVIVAVAAAVAINARAFDDPWHLKIDPLLRERVEAEYEHATGEHSGLALATPNVFCVRVAANEVMPHAWALGAIGAATVLGVAIRRRRWPLTRWTIVLAAFPTTFAIVLAQDIIPFERYALPLTVFGYLIAANVAAAALATIRRRAIAGLSTALVAAIVIVAQGDRCVRFDHQFADDSRERLREWLAANLPPNTIVVADWYADVYGRGDPWRFPTQSTPRLNIRGGAGYVGAAGPIDRLAASGVRYAIVVDTSYRRFFFPEIHATPGNEDWFERTRSNYRDLFARGELVWQSGSEPPSNSYADPLIRVYRIDRLRKPSAEPPPPPSAAERWLKMMAERKAATTTRATN